MEFPGKYREDRGVDEESGSELCNFYRMGGGRLEIARWLRSRSNPCSRFSGPGHPRSMQFLWDRCSTKSDWKLDNAPYTSMFVNWMYIVGYHREYQSEQQHAQIHHSPASIVMQTTITQMLLLL